MGIWTKIKTKPQSPTQKLAIAGKGMLVRHTPNGESRNRGGDMVENVTLTGGSDLLWCLWWYRSICRCWGCTCWRGHYTCRLNQKTWNMKTVKNLRASVKQNHFFFFFFLHLIESKNPIKKIECVELYIWWKTDSYNMYMSSFFLCWILYDFF